MATLLLTQQPICSICYEPVPIETCKTDEHGQAVHEDCYVLRLKLIQESKPPEQS